MGQLRVLKTRSSRLPKLFQILILTHTLHMTYLLEIDSNSMLIVAGIVVVVIIVVVVVVVCCHHCCFSACSL